ncbi:hypothetical protein H5410_027712 [Solanum commersonii]|uniref:Uncharacterized protein n=1 Tax=Solanum commersonii TaxID=4109 RepID=A0A9J5Z448_SOLCO|nr:hypothetical protein H5410_027712 [Solanum commersonii]
MKICESPIPFGELPIEQYSPFVPVCLALKELSKSAVKRSNQRIAEQLHEALLHRPLIQDRKMLKANDEGQQSRPKGGWPSASRILPYFIQFLHY